MKEHDRVTELTATALRLGLLRGLQWELELAVEELIGGEFPECGRDFLLPVLPEKEEESSHAAASRGEVMTGSVPAAEFWRLVAAQAWPEPPSGGM